MIWDTEDVLENLIVALGAAVDRVVAVDRVAAADHAAAAGHVVAADHDVVLVLVAAGNKRPCPFGAGLIYGGYMRVLEKYGTGLECAFELVDEGTLDEVLKQLDIVEIIPEGFLSGERQWFLERLAKAGTPVIGHSVELSIGSTDFHLGHLQKVTAVLDQVNTVAMSDHLCFTRQGGINIGQLTTLPFTQESADTVSRNIDLVTKEISQPFLIENITNRYLVPDCDFEEPEFISSILNRTSASLLLDVTNLYTNAVNHNFDAKDWLSRIPIEETQGIHLAGGNWEDGYLYDSHNSRVPQDVWNLYAEVLAKVDPQITIVEWDQNVPKIEVLLAEVATAKILQSRVNHNGVIAHVSP